MISRFAAPRTYEANVFIFIFFFRALSCIGRIIKEHLKRRKKNLTDVFALVESLGYFPGEHRVDGADNDENDGISECDHVASVDVTVANEEIIFACGIMVHGLGRVDDHPDAVYQDLNEDQHRTDNQLRSRRDEGRPLRTVLARAKNTGNPVGFRQQGRINDGKAEASGEPAKVKSP